MRDAVETGRWEGGSSRSGVGGSEGRVWWPELGSVKGIKEKWVDFRHKINRTWSLIDLGTEDSLQKCRASHLGSQSRLHTT